MKKLLSYILLAVLILICIDLVFGWTMDTLRRKSRSGHSALMENICQREEYDIIVMGSSRACHHYDVDLMEQVLRRSIINAGMEGHGIITMYGILEMIVKRYTPSLIIYDVTPEFDYLQYYADGDLTRYITPLKPYFHQSEIQAIISDISPIDHYLLYSSLYRYNSSGPTIIKDYYVHTSPVISSKGFIPLIEAMDTVQELPKVIDYKLHEKKSLYFNKFIELCKKYNITIILISSPKLGARDSSIFEWCQKIAVGYGIGFYNYYTDESFAVDATLFHDPTHLNQEGAHLYTAMILKQVQQDIINPLD